MASFPVSPSPAGSLAFAVSLNEPPGAAFGNAKDGLASGTLPPIHPASKAADVLARPDLAWPVLTRCPFPEAITAGSSERAGTFALLATEGLTAIKEQLTLLARPLAASQKDKQVPLERGAVPERSAVPQDWQRASLARQLSQWRVFETFRLLHVRGWCPALLFRLTTKTDLLVLCDPAADSSALGYGQRQKRVLTKGGIGDRFSWAAARQMVAAMGLLGAQVLSDDGAHAGAAEEALEEALAANDDNAPEDVKAGGVSAVGASSEETGAAKVTLAAPSAEEGRRAGARPEGMEEPFGEKEPAGEALPPLQLDRVWAALPTYTKKQLGAVYERFGVGLWSQFSDRFYASMRKPEMLAFVRRTLRHHACLEAAQQLTDRQLEALHDWMQLNLTGRYQRDDDLRIAARLFSDFQAAAALSAGGHGLLPESWKRYRDAELRRIAAFCYHRFYEAPPSSDAT